MNMDESRGVYKFLHFANNGVIWNFFFLSLKCLSFNAVGSLCVELLWHNANQSSFETTLTHNYFTNLTSAPKILFSVLQ